MEKTEKGHDFGEEISSVMANLKINKYCNEKIPLQCTRKNVMTRYKLGCVTQDQVHC
jgi:hypothetical protein